MRSLPDPGFAGDDGAAGPELVAALAAYDAQPDSRELWLTALWSLQDARVLVPVVTTAAGEDPIDTGSPVEGLTDMAAVLMRGPSGRTALLAFTGLGPMRVWDPRARPVPVRVPDAARAALQNGAEALVVDVAGPVLFAVADDDLRSLAAGDRLARVGEAGWGWVRPG
jgi:type III secretion system (T3SS) SseB-like protein